MDRIELPAELPPPSHPTAGSFREPAVFRRGRVFPREVHVSGSASFEGPLPPPALLAEYEQALPGLAERLVRMAEREGEHRRSLQRRAMRLAEGGLASAFAVPMTALLGGFYLVLNDKSPEGMGIIIGAVGSLVAVYFVRAGRRPGTPPPP